ncbi:DUF748 domain-containing protein [Rhodanobacter sp. 7MK24]|uniref:DUF748 domain-containing protein n=1 Tax=Rhodanobacter sp. 7MK24 TaxID=2775922 RepID=UPI0017831147|nr:DUF748 domain-containing protein [Rhodanobacter sp. 7MK24]MBD8882195.1 DUF748 domain-containing protein [Rhodanobacter sp. 7MK24]
MNDPRPAASPLAMARDRAERLYRSRRTRKTALVIGIVLVVFGLLGFLVAPPIIKSQLQTRLTALLDRPVSVDAVHLDPFTLRLELDKLHIGDRDGHSPFVDIDRAVVNASWTSLFRLAPILDELSLQHPQLHIARTAPQQFNFSDLIAKFSGGPPKPDNQPARFALSNISVTDGDITFADAVSNATHRIDHLQVGIPFIANLPRDTDVFVQPLLAMNVDGSPLRIAGQTKPFADSLESDINFSLDHLDLPRYLGYVPAKLPVAIPSGQLSGKLDLQFVQAKSGPQIRLGGQLQLDDFALATPDNAPLLELAHADAALADVEPLLSRYRLGAMLLNGLSLHYTRTAGGHSNFDALTGGDSAKPAAPAKAATPATEVGIAALTLQGGRFEYTDASGHKPATLALENIHGTLRGLSTIAAPPAALDIATTLNGGNLALSGKLDVANSRYDGKLGLKGVGLPPLLPLAPPMLNAELAKGTLAADGRLLADWGKNFNLTLRTTTATINDLALQQGKRTPLAWQSLEAGITQLDLASSTAQLDHVTLHGLQVEARRLQNGNIDLTDLMKSEPTHGSHKPSPPSPSWHWSIAHVGIDGTLALTDPRIAGKNNRTALKLAHANFDDLSSDMRKPLKLALEGGIGRGSLRVDGTLRPQPLDANLRVRTTRLDIAPLQSLATVPLNVTLTSATLSADGRLRYRDHQPQALMDWRGGVTLGNVRVQDKLTGDDFLRWNSLDASGLTVHMGEDVPHVSVAGLALDDFYARVIINTNGRTNMQDVVANPAAAPVSVTQTRQNPAAPAAKPQVAATTASPPPAGTAAAPAADIQIGGITLARGHLNYTDNFIKPNYTANITDLAGKVGAFGTAGGPPADMDLQGQLDDNAPVNITGTINPLAPTASLDVKGKADGVELTHLSPYSGKYTGYPITKGRLTMDVHYQLDNGKLNADNHIFITQLTFGDAIQGPSISHLPVKLAVALLKDADGNIDVDVPVSGSLDDPQFSVGGLIWHAFVNLIGRAVTSPFRLIASAMGGGGKQQDLGYVEFAPGSAVLDAKAQEKLDQIVKILQQKTALKLDVTGRVDPKFDESGLRKVMVDDLVQQEAGEGADLAKLTPDQYDKYLKKAYKHAKFPKPRDAIGLTKSQPSDVMRKLLETNMPVDEDALRHLAERRADAVRAALRGKLADNRVFVLAPKVDAKGIDDAGKTTRVDFGLH